MKISVVVTCYNEKKFIHGSINSVVQQTRFDLIDKVVVVDDGSEDGSIEIIRQFEDENPKVELFSQENQGLPGARNTGLEHCTGDFVALQDGDDIWLEHKIERQAQVLEQYPDVGIVYSDFYLFGDGDRKRANPNSYQYSDGDVLERLFCNGGPIVPSTAIINSECFSTVGNFDRELLRAQDTDLWLRIAEEYRLHHIDEPLVERRVREDSLGKSHRKKTRYLMRVTDTAVSRNPELRPHARKRKAMILVSRGRKLVEEGERWEAIRMALRALVYQPLSVEMQATFLFTITPLPRSVLTPVLRMARRMRGTVQSA